MSLRARIVLAVVGATAVALVLAGWVTRQAVRTEFATVVDVALDDAGLDVIDEWIETKGTLDGIAPVLENLDAAYELRMILTDEDENVIVDTRPAEVVPPLADLPAYQFVPNGADTLLLFTISIERSSSDNSLASLDRSFLLAGVGSLAIAGLVGLWLASLISGPVRGLTDAVGRMGAGERSARAPSDGLGEIGVLAGSFNELADDLERSESVRQSMLADASHELRTPLANLKGHLEGILDGVVEPDDETMTGLVGDVDRLGGLIDDLQSLSLAEAGEITLTLTPAEPAVLLGRVAAAHSARAKAEDVSLVVSAPADLPLVAVDQLRIDQILGNLVGNAMRYGNKVVLSARAASGQVELIVADDGPGIPTDQLDLIFERFHRTDASRDRATGGGGLGLAIVAQLVRLHGGEVVAENAQSETGESRTGSMFTVRLPAVG